MTSKSDLRNGMGEKQDSTKGFTMQGVRYLFTLLSFIGFIEIYAIRVNLNVAILAMVNQTAIHHEHHTDNLSAAVPGECKIDDEVVVSNITHQIKPVVEGEFVWSPQLQGVILGAFYYGYIVTQVPGGRLAEIFSAKWIYGFGTVISAVLSLLTPWAARTHTGWLIAIRALEGLAQGVTIPAMHCLLGRWLPTSEKGLLGSLVYTGINIGTVLSMTFTGILCDSSIMGGWPSTFYFVGMFGCVWFALWAFFVSDTPLTARFITQEEIDYIVSNQQIKHDVKLPPIPWKRIFTSVPFWALICTQIGQDWSLFTLLADMPTYFSTVLNINIAESGFLASFPYVIQTVTGILIGYFTDLMVRRRIVTVRCVRKFCNSAASLGAAVGVLLVAVAGCNITLSVVAFTSVMALNGFVYCGFYVGHLDLSPEYAGTLMGIANGISSSTGFLAPIVVGALTEENNTLVQWRYVFGITFAIQVITCFIFIFFGTTEKQDWVKESRREVALEPMEQKQLRSEEEEEA